MEQIQGETHDELIINQTYDLLDKRYFNGKNYVLPRPQGLSTIDRIDVRNFKGNLQPYLNKQLGNMKVKIYALPSVDAFTLNINFNSGSSTPIRRYQFDSSQNTGVIAPLFEIEQSWFYDPNVTDQFYNNILLAIAKISHYFDPSFSRYISINDFKFIASPLKFYESEISSYSVYDKIVGSNCRSVLLTKQDNYAAANTYYKTTPMSSYSTNEAWTFINGLIFDGLFVAVTTGNRHILVKDYLGYNEAYDLYAGYAYYENSAVIASLVYDATNETNHLKRNSLYVRNGNSAQILRSCYNSSGARYDFLFPKTINNILAMHDLPGEDADETKLAFWYETRNGVPVVVCYCDAGHVQEITIPYVSLDADNITLLSLLVYTDNRSEEDPTNVTATIINNRMSFRVDFRTGQFVYYGRFFEPFLEDTAEIQKMKEYSLFNINVKYSLADFDYSKMYKLDASTLNFDYGVFTNADAPQLILDHLSLINDPVFTASLNEHFPQPATMHSDVFSDQTGDGVLCYKHVNDGANIYTFTTYRCSATDTYRLYADMTSSYKDSTITYEMKNTDLNTNFATAPLNAEYYKLVDENGAFTDDLASCYITTPVLCMKYRSGGAEYIADPVVNFGLVIQTDAFEFTTSYSAETNNDYTLTPQILRFKFRSNESFESISQSYNMRILLQNEYNNLYLASPSMNNINSIIYYLNEEAKIRFKNIQISPNTSQLLVNVNSDDAEQLTPDDLKVIYGSVTVSIDWVKRI